MPSQYISVTPQAKDTVYAVTQAVMTVLRHSTNPAFITTVLGHLKVSTLEEAELRLGQHLWSILHKHLHVELPLDVAEELAALPLLPPSSPSRTCTTRDRSNREEETSNTDLSPAPEECSQLLSSLPLCGELLGSAMNSSQGYCEPQGEDSGLLQFDLALPAASEPASQEHEHRLEGSAAEHHVQTDIERLCDQVLCSSTREEPAGHHPVECNRLEGSAAEHHVQTDIERLCDQVLSSSARKDLVEDKSTGDNSPVTSPRQPEATVVLSPPRPSSDCHEEVFEKSQEQNTDIQEQEPQDLDGENDSSPVAAKNRILENSTDMRTKEVTDIDMEKNIGSEPVKNQILEALALLSSSLSLTASLQAWSQTPPSSSSQGSPFRQLLSGLPQEWRGMHESRRLQESETLMSSDNREVLDTEGVAPQVDRRPLNDAACVVPNPTPVLRVRRDLWSGEQTTVTSETRNVSGCHNFSRGNTEMAEVSEPEAAEPNLAPEAGPSRLSIVQRQRHLSSQPALPPTSSSALPQATRKKKRNKSLEKSLCRPSTKRMRVPKAQGSSQIPATSRPPRPPGGRHHRPTKEEGGGGKAARWDDKDDDFRVAERRSDDNEECSPSLLEGLTYESVVATLTESFQWARARNSPSSECPEGRQNGAPPGKQDTSLQALEDSNTPENLGGEVDSPSTPPKHTHAGSTPSSETLAPQNPTKDTTEATRNLTHTFLTSKESERAAASPANTPAALHSTYGPSQPGSEPEKARQPGENLVRVMRLGNVINETSAPEATAGQEASLSPANLPARLSACLAPHSAPSTQPLQAPCSPPAAPPYTHPGPPFLVTSALPHTYRAPPNHFLIPPPPHALQAPASLTLLSHCIPLSICSSSPQVTEPPSAQHSKSNTLQPCGSSPAMLSPSTSQHSRPATPQPCDSSTPGSTPHFVSLSTVTLDSSVEVLEEESDEVGVVVEGEKSSGELQEQGSSEVSLVDLTSPVRDPSTDPRNDSDDLTG
ncbi:hypothetical protein O3P69_002926 [Scylla paramamosain]|uniref:Uncharacterized protein n=1 Tax=Scylla paramamosain TaxID=85552 RepID=A0AAW0UIB4_SCYPA